MAAAGLAKVPFEHHAVPRCPPPPSTQLEMNEQCGSAPKGTKTKQAEVEALRWVPRLAPDVTRVITSLRQITDFDVITRGFGRDRTIFIKM